MGKTPIEWATHTENWLAGCTKVSPACTHCYAETMTARLATMPHAPERYRDGVIKDRRWTGQISYSVAPMLVMFQELATATKPRRVFCNSMSDTFHANVPAESLTDLADQIETWDRCWWRTDTGCKRADAVGEEISTMERRTRGRKSVIMLLTKRPDRMLAWQREHFPDGLPSWVWVGCTVENQAAADERIPHLLSVPARVRFLSCEPLLSAISLQPWMQVIDHCVDCGAEFQPQGSDFCPECGSDHAIIRTETAGEAERFRSGERYAGTVAGKADVAGRPVDAIHWVISGGEGGPKARPTHPDWFRSLRDQCAEAGVAFILKQIGEWAPHDGPVSASVPSWRRWWATTDGRITANPDGAAGYWMMRIGKHKSGRTLDGITHDGFPEVDDG